ncbi:hypothetical protein B0H21DRAFT_704746, partial [Amylocystis lapponica]
HEKDCRNRFSFYILPGVGMTDGEAPERIWATLNAIASRTKEMSSGHRHDVINDFHSDMNARRVHSIVSALVAKHIRAVAQLQMAEETLAQVETTVKQKADDGAAKLREWRAAEALWLVRVLDLSEHRNLDDPYKPRKEKGLTQREMLGALKANDRAAGATQQGVIGSIAEGIALADTRQVCKQWRLMYELSQGLPGSLAESEARVQAFLLKADAWASRAELYLMPFVNDAAAALQDADDDSDFPWSQHDAVGATFGYEDESDDEDGSTHRTAVRRAEDVPDVNSAALYSEVEAVHIALPSACDERVIRHACMRKVVDIEHQLRKGAAEDALDDLRTQLITSYAFKVDQKNISGQIANTRATAKTRSKWRAVEHAAAAYRRARRVMCRLAGAPTPDVRRLRRSDVRALLLYLADDAPGTNKQRPSWIWDDLSFMEGEDKGALKEYYDETARVHWFRRSALRTRWHEELLLVEEEMRRTLRFFGHWKVQWARTAAAHEREERVGSDARAAFARR